MWTKPQGLQRKEQLRWVHDGGGGSGGSSSAGSDFAPSSRLWRNHPRCSQNDYFLLQCSGGRGEEEQDPLLRAEDQLKERQWLPTWRIVLLLAPLREGEDEEEEEEEQKKKKKKNKKKKDKKKEKKDKQEKKKNDNNVAVVVAEAEEEQSILEAWAFIEANIMPKIELIVVEEVEEANKRQQQKLSEQSLGQKIDTFLLLQFQMLYLNESNEQIVQRQQARARKSGPNIARNNNSKSSVPTPTTVTSVTKAKSNEISPRKVDDSSPPSPSDEEVITAFPCSLWVKIRYRGGEMTVRYSHLTFSSVGMKDVLVRFMEVTALTKETSRMGVYRDSLRIKTKSEELFFSGIERRDDVYELLSQLWNIDMENRLRKVKRGTSASLDSPRTSCTMEDGAQHRNSIDLSSDYDEEEDGTSEDDSISVGAIQAEKHNGKPLEKFSGEERPRSLGKLEQPEQQRKEMKEQRRKEKDLKKKNAAQDNERGTNVSRNESEGDGFEKRNKYGIPKLEMSFVEGNKLKRDSKKLELADKNQTIDSEEEQNKQSCASSPKKTELEGAMTMEGTVAQRELNANKSKKGESDDDKEGYDERLRQKPEEAAKLVGEKDRMDPNLKPNGSISNHHAEKKEASRLENITNSGSRTHRVLSLLAKKKSTKEILDLRKRNEHYQTLFHLPAEEVLELKMDCSLRVKNIFVAGKLYVSPDFVCFHSLLPEDENEDRNKRRSLVLSRNSAGIGVVDITQVLGGVVMEGISQSQGLMRRRITGEELTQVVIPFTEISDIVLQDIGSIGSTYRPHLVNINTRRNKFLLSFPIPHAYEKLLRMWKNCCLDRSFEGHVFETTTISSSSAPQHKQHHQNNSESDEVSNENPEGDDNSQDADGDEKEKSGSLSHLAFSLSTWGAAAASKVTNKRNAHSYGFAQSRNRRRPRQTISLGHFMPSEDGSSSTPDDPSASLLPHQRHSPRRKSRPTDLSPRDSLQEQRCAPFSSMDWRNPEHWRMFFGEEFNLSVDLAAEHQKRAMWKEYFREHGMGIDMIKTQEFARLVREGVPNELRSKIWQLCSGSVYKPMTPKRKGHYDQLWEQFAGMESLATEEIEKDLHRSFDHAFYRNGGPGINSLRRVLTAYSWHRPSIGYCQSMNIVCAVFLLFLNEEEAFWLLSTVVDEMLKGYYTKEMLGSCVDQRVFEVLFAENLPRLYAHINEILQIPIAWFSLPWFLCLFIGKLPLKCVLRILDCFFCEGSPCVLFQVALALFKITEVEVLAMEQGEDDGSAVLHIMRQKAMADPENLFRVAFGANAFPGTLTMDKINQLRNSYKLQVILELEEEKKKDQEWKRNERRARRLKRQQQQQQKQQEQAIIAMPAAVANMEEDSEVDENMKVRSHKRKGSRPSAIMARSLSDEGETTMLNGVEKDGDESLVASASAATAVVPHHHRRTSSIEEKRSSPAFDVDHRGDKACLSQDLRSVRKRSKSLPPTLSFGPPENDEDITEAEGNRRTKFLRRKPKLPKLSSSEGITELPTSYEKSRQHRQSQQRMTDGGVLPSTASNSERENEVALLRNLLAAKGLENKKNKKKQQKQKKEKEDETEQEEFIFASPTDIRRARRASRDDTESDEDDDYDDDDSELTTDSEDSLLDDRLSASTSSLPNPSTAAPSLSSVPPSPVLSLPPSLSASSIVNKEKKGEKKGKEHEAAQTGYLYSTPTFAASESQLLTRTSSSSSIITPSSSIKPSSKSEGAKIGGASEAGGKEGMGGETSPKAAAAAITPYRLRLADMKAMKNSGIFPKLALVRKGASYTTHLASSSFSTAKAAVTSTATRTTSLFNAAASSPSSLPSSAASPSLPSSSSSSPSPSENPNAATAAPFSSWWKKVPVPSTLFTPNSSNNISNNDTNSNKAQPRPQPSFAGEASHSPDVAPLRGRARTLHIVPRVALTASPRTSSSFSSPSLSSPHSASSPLVPTIITSSSSISSCASSTSSSAVSSPSNSFSSLVDFKGVKDGEIVKVLFEDEDGNIVDTRTGSLLPSPTSSSASFSSVPASPKLHPDGDDEEEDDEDSSP
ncbi:GTPase activating protein (GAP) [Balamuthia mandrillaris]